MSDASPRLRVLHLIARLAPLSAPYNEHCLGAVGDRELAVCSVFEPETPALPAIPAFPGDGTVRGFWRAMNRALASWPHDVVHAHAPVTGILLLAARWLRGRSLSNAVYTVHNSYANYRRRNRLLLYPIFASFPTIVVCSNSVLDTLPWSLRWLARHKLWIAQNAVNIKRIDRALSSATLRRLDGFTVVSAARLISRKDPHTLLAAFARHGNSEARLILVGDGPLREELARQVRADGLARDVAFTGLVDRDDVYRIFAGADLFVSTSRGEGLPVAVLEAMAAGCPVVLSDIAPHREIVGRASFIHLVPPGDAEGFARGIQRFREMSPQDRARIGQRCRALVEQRFSLPAMHRAYGEIYRGVARGSAGAGTVLRSA